jgi:hypothetical protein
MVGIYLFVGMVLQEVQEMLISKSEKIILGANFR